jgi:hypothetical protein
MIMFGNTSELVVVVSTTIQAIFLNGSFANGDCLTRLLLSPLISYESVTNCPERIANIKNFTLFEEDVANNKLPQWMFITPNMSKFSFLCLYLCSLPQL